MSKPRTVTYIDGRLAFAQMSEEAQKVITRAALSKHMAELGRRSNNADPAKRAIISAAMKKRWADFRANREAERQRIIKENGYLPDWTPPPKPKKPKILTRREALEIGYKELLKTFPQGMTEQNKAEFMSWKPRDPRLQPFL